MHQVYCSEHTEEIRISSTWWIKKPLENRPFSRCWRICKNNLCLWGTYLQACFIFYCHNLSNWPRPFRIWNTRIKVQISEGQWGLEEEHFVIRVTCLKHYFATAVWENYLFFLSFSFWIYNISQLSSYQDSSLYIT